MKFGLRLRIAKSATKGNMAFGWASTMTIDGRSVVDYERERIPVDELEPAAYRYAERQRVAGEQHKRVGVGVLIESCFLSKEKQEAMGIDMAKEGWWVGFRITDSRTLAKVRSGELSEFSIHGEADKVRNPDGTVTRQNIEIDEISFVDAGGGKDVPVALVKQRGAAPEDGMNKFVKMIRAALAKSKAGTRAQRNEIRETLEAWGTELSKSEVLTLDDVKEKLGDEALWGVVLQALAAAKMETAAPISEGAADEIEKEDPEETPPASPAEIKKKKKAKAADPGDEDDGDEDESVSLSKELKAERKMREKLEKRVAQSEVREKEARRRETLSKAKATLEKSMGFIPGDTDDLAEALVALEQIADADGEPVVIDADIAATISKALTDASAALGESNLFEMHGAGKGGKGPDVDEDDSDPRVELKKAIKEEMDADKTLKKAAAESRVLAKRGDLYKRLKDAGQG